MEKFPQKIKLSELRSAISHIFDHMEKMEDLQEITLDHDYYNCLSFEDTYEFYKSSKHSEPPELLVGQLYDDWEFLESMLRDDSACRPMLMHVAALLHYIGWKPV